MWGGVRENLLNWPLVSEVIPPSSASTKLDLYLVSKCWKTTSKMKPVSIRAEAVSDKRSRYPSRITEKLALA